MFQDELVFFRLKTFLNHLGYMLYIRTVCCFECGCEFVDVNQFSSAVKVKSNEWIV